MITKLVFAAALLPAFEAHAISLEDALAQQSQIEIKPVAYQGLSFAALGGPLPAANAAAHLCAALGFARLVKFTTEPCAPGEKFGAFLKPSASVSQFAKVARVCEEGGVRERLASVTCAK